MVQAKRRKLNRKSEPREKVSFSGVGMLLIGMVIGSLSTILWQGTKKADGGVGTGIRQMIETSRTADQQQPQPPITQIEQLNPQDTDFDFYTVLPEMEVVVVDHEAVDQGGADQGELAQGEMAQGEMEEPQLLAQSEDANNGNFGGPLNETAGVEANGEGEPPSSTSASTGADKGSQYMLQAGSYRVAAQAERLRANLAIRGLISTIQKVTIQGQGDFYRVRLGPFATYDDMVVVDQKLAQMGVKSLWLKTSGG